MVLHCSILFVLFLSPPDADSSVLKGQGKVAAKMTAWETAKPKHFLSLDTFREPHREPVQLHIPSVVLGALSRLGGMVEKLSQNRIISTSPSNLPDLWLACLPSSLIIFGLFL